ncbi:MAG: HAD hydrolase-like protein [Planctomycetes bacterium]|nr:HAD hydrolase-like protein [Planctomycetota bacterium]
MRLDDFDALLLDMDGTLYREHHALPGSPETVTRLLAEGRRVICVTNNGANTPEELATRLQKMGLAFPPGAIHTACHSMADWITSRWPKPRIFNFAGSALEVELKGRATFVERIADPCDVVAVGTHTRENNVPFDFERALVGLNLLRAGAHLVVGCADRVFPIQGGAVEFGSGSWGALFGYGADVPADRWHHTGKPGAWFFESLCHRVSVRPERCLIIGDNLESDIKGGVTAGMKTALVLTGVSTREQATRSPFKPDVVFEDLAAVYRAMR